MGLRTLTEKLSWCNICDGETKHDKDGCVYHQRVLIDEDGFSYLKYDEFY